MRLPLQSIVLLAAVSLVLGGCASGRSLSFFPGVHKINIMQGNIVTQEKVDQLRSGMTRNQVRFLLGTPLISDPFHLDQWNYVYSLRDPNGIETRQELKITFEDGALATIEGDYTPSSVADSEDDLS